MPDARHPWPMMVIDFEASSLEQDGFPIEVGLACWAAPDATVEGWSTLIRPDWRWTSNGHWSAASALVHGISARDLAAHGREPAQVAAALNEAIGSGTIAWCDGGRYDAHWTMATIHAKSSHRGPRPRPVRIRPAYQQNERTISI